MIWNVYGIALSVVLIIGIFYQINGLFEFAVGGGGAWILIQSIENICRKV